MRILAGILLGAWLTGTCVVAWVAAQNFFMIDRLLDEPTSAAFAAAVDKLPQGEARMTLRYLSSELNRYYFSAWGWIGIGLGFALLGISTKLESPPPDEDGSPRRKQLRIGFGLMTAISAALVLYLTPQIVDVGRQLDYVLPTATHAARAPFGKLHGLYSSLELLKLLIGLWMCIVLTRAGNTR